MSAAATIGAEQIVTASQDQVFSFLCDLRNHWLLADRMVEVVSIDDGNGGRASGGKVRLRGPLGIRRTVTTEVTRQQPPSEVYGIAKLSGGTRATVSWTLSPRSDHATCVRLEASVEHVRLADRLLLMLGGRRWLRRRFAVVLQTLSDHVA